MLFHKEEINTFCFTIVSKRSPWQLYNMYSRAHIPPYYRCTKFENFLPIHLQRYSSFCEFYFNL